MSDSAEPDFAARDPDMAEDALGLGLPPVSVEQPTAPAPTPVETSGGYRVLARKYRPQTFSELIGQDAMVQTLANAIRRGRLAHAFLMTGVRGVGKTSTARLVAKALNCIGPDGTGGPTIDPCGVCEPCRAIAEGRHIDVIEMDAASHTGVDDVREIIEAVRYAAVSARYKIYIIDEVHMLSKNAFNALLKTLEEPPPHVKFLFATTEVNKVPVTVLSRCQRFDLRRIPAAMLAHHFAEVCAKEAVPVEAEALAMIARAADGSVRDGLSILDQAIAHADMAGGDDEGEGTGAGGTGFVRAEAVRTMLGLTDRGATRRLFALLVEGKGSEMLAELAAQHRLGIDPAALIAGLMEQCHAVMRAKLAAPTDPLAGEDAVADWLSWAGRLSEAELHRIWQLLLKGHEEVRSAAIPTEACEMALLRVVHGARLPDPGTLARLIAEGQGMSDAARAPSPAAATAEAAVADAAAFSATVPADFAALVDAVAEVRPVLGAQMRAAIRLIDYAPPLLRFALARPFPDLARELVEVLRGIDGRSWRIELADAGGDPPLLEAARAERDAARQAVLASPVVRAAFAHFPDAVLEDDTGDGGAQPDVRSRLA